ncbi:MAG: CerR family C-terminal domain-containing protein [Phycisphaeraceae bacterium]|nr:CerR family C-terminal domain-containing protein [Phycisphaeraceae bacterium]
MAATDPNTIERLLEAAESLFAEKGFAATSVRDITQAADCNVSAVNYHFDSKQKLYEQVFERRLQVLRTVRLEAVGRVIEDAAGHNDLSVLLGAFAEAFLAPLLDPKHGPRTVRLMMRELVTPRLPEGMILSRLIEPIREAMVSAMVRCVPGLSESRALLCLHSFIGQLVHVLQMTRIHSLGGPGSFRQISLEDVLKHVVCFSVAGMRAVAGSESESEDG